MKDYENAFNLEMLIDSLLDDGEKLHARWWESSELRRTRMGYP